MMRDVVVESKATKAALDEFGNDGRAERDAIPRQ